MNSYVEHLALAFQRSHPRGTDRSDDSREVKCPVCFGKLDIQRVEGLRVDVCDAHGVWFDVGEVEQLISRVRQGERAAVRKQLQNAEEDDNPKLGEIVIELLKEFFE